MRMIVLCGILSFFFGCKAARELAGVGFGAFHSVIVDADKYGCAGAPEEVRCRRVNGPLVYSVAVEGGWVLIDSGFEESATQLKAFVDTHPVLAILLTHGHIDHISGAHAFGDTPVYISTGDLPMIRGDEHNGIFITQVSELLIGKPALPRDLRSVDDDELLRFGGRDFRAIALPGHTPGSTAWLSEGLLFSGDALQVEPSDDDAVIIVPHPDYPEQTLANLQKLQGFDISLILDAHWGQIDDVARKIQDGIDRHRD